MSVKEYKEITVADGETSAAFSIDQFNSALAVQIQPVGTARVELSLFAEPTSLQWEPWIFGDVSTTTSAEFSSAVKAVRIVSVSGVANAAVSSLG